MSEKNLDHVKVLTREEAIARLNLEKNNYDDLQKGYMSDIID